MEQYTNEIWKQLYEFKDYRVSNYGRILSVQRKVSIGIRNGKEYFRTSPQRIKKLRTNNIEPFLFAQIYYTDDKGKKINKTVYIHKAVADHFCEKPEHILEAERKGFKIYASHIIKDYTNNHYTNIRFITQLILIRSQPKRLADPSKSWRTRREKYGNRTGSANPPKYNHAQMVKTKLEKKLRSQQSEK